MDFEMISPLLSEVLQSIDSCHSCDSDRISGFLRVIEQCQCLLHIRPCHFDGSATRISEFKVGDLIVHVENDFGRFRCPAEIVFRNRTSSVVSFQDVSVAVELPVASGLV
mmetsp:Transcript_32379/g.51610  ORF Transcript_32379/g.51610 Transcript_32379/m.51610 type:complete len:110 (+) Transcript_32379:454-783(+)